MRKRLLLVDDSRAQRAAVRRMLVDYELDIFEAGNGALGVALADDVAV